MEEGARAPQAPPPQVAPLDAKHTIGSRDIFRITLLSELKSECVKMITPLTWVGLFLRKCVKLCEDYWKCNFPMTRSVRLPVGRSVSQAFIFS